MIFLTLDIGSTYIKGAVSDLTSGTLHHVRRIPFPAPIEGTPPGHFEVDPAAILEVVQTVVDDLLPHAPDCQGILSCSQMHAFLLVDDAGRACSNVITWKDQRAAGDLFDQIAGCVSPADLRATGNELRVGLPICALVHMAQAGTLPPKAMPASMPDWVLGQLCGVVADGVEISNAGAYGCLDLASGDWHRPTLAALGLGHLTFPTIRGWDHVLGHYRGIPIFTPVGDHQAALAGVGLRPGELSINIATGGQVSMLSGTLHFGTYQTRPYFDDLFLSSAVNVPAGQGLGVMVDFVTEVAALSGTPIDNPWAAINRAVDATPSTDLQVDMAFFDGNVGAITHIDSENLHIGALFRAAFNRMAASYAEAAQALDPTRSWTRILLTGGVMHKSSHLRSAIAEQFGMEPELIHITEDTLSGLTNLVASTNESHTHHPQPNYPGKREYP